MDHKTDTLVQFALPAAQRVFIHSGRSFEKRVETYAKWINACPSTNLLFTNEDEDGFFIKVGEK